MSLDAFAIAGPHHSHPRGEIDMIMPEPVHGPGTAHHPTVSDGRAIVVYLLPQGAIRFTRS